ncbi:hypothetical protein B566_EDAN015704 [Ephemera danica]|nr:hypothetical protein B566_EDAN015704 [Ephemera danica]
MLQRQRNFRPTWTVDLQEPVAGNYYPITTAIAMDNPVNNSRLIVLTDRAQGGSSINDGELELMVHRRLLHDDNFGVDEALDEHAFGAPLVARGKHLVILGSRTTSPTAMSLQRKITLNKLILAPWVLLTP